MSDAPVLTCRVDRRRQKLFDNPDWNGIDYLDVADDQLSLCVHFFDGIPEGLTPDNVRVVGGRRIRDIQVVRVDPDPSHDEELDDCLKITLDRPGDFSTYTLCLIDVPGIDPRFRCLDFSFKTNCASDLDCGDVAPCPPEPRVEPDINYLAKDYAGFRQLIYDRLALTLPDWRERHVPDLGVTLVELLAYAGDYLSYYQDAVATEAYLDTARQRISIRRHLRLIDYALHEGCNARAFVTVSTSTDFASPAPDGFFFVTGVDGLETYGGSFATADALAKMPEQNYLVFEPLGLAGPVTFRAAHNRIAFHDWGDGECCLPKGATSATLVDHADPPPTPPDEPKGDGNGDAPPPEDAPPPAPRIMASAVAADAPRLQLAVGDYLLFEEVLGPFTGSPADADPTHRHVVRLTRVTPARDALLGIQLLDIEWAAEDALPFPLCISSRRPTPDCDSVRDVSVARGNVVAVDHGRSWSQPLDPVEGADLPGECACEGSVIEVRRQALPYAPSLEHAPLTFAEPLGATASAAALLVRDPRAALPAIRLVDGTETWLPLRDLLSSSGDDRVFVVESDDEGFAHLRFGDGLHGRVLDVGAAPVAAYRNGGGTAGNVGREAIGLLVIRDGIIDGADITVRNPIAASGGTNRESTAEARLFAPGMIQARRERAIIADDYAELATRDDPQLQGAAAKLCWTGSWHEARVAIDPLHREDCPPELIAQVTQALQRYRRIGHDLAVAPARIVPLHLAMHVCVLPHYNRAQVKGALLDLFSSHLRTNGTKGFFHPDNWRFGQAVALSQVIAAAMTIEGIETVRVTALQRLDQPDDTSALDNGRLVLRPGEIAQLDNDPNFPENGKLEFDVGGGR
ncbi:MAG: putative baseplate assembly protein [Sphingomonas sp.]